MPPIPDVFLVSPQRRQVTPSEFSNLTMSPALVKLPVVLVVEDNPDDQELAELAMKRVGFRCQPMFVEDGLEALEYLRDCGSVEKPRPDLLLVDLYHCSSGFDRTPSGSSSPC